MPFLLCGARTADSEEKRAEISNAKANTIATIGFARMERGEKMYTQTNLFGDDLSEEKSIIYESIEEAEQAAIERIKLASQFSEYYYHAPILIAYSGGKDSDVLLRLVQKSGVKYEVIHSVTTLDAPETNRHVNEVFERERERGERCLNCEVSPFRVGCSKL